MAKFTIEAKAKMGVAHKLMQAAGIAGFHHVHESKESMTLTIDQPLPAGTYTVDLDPVAGHSDGMTISGTIA